LQRALRIDLNVVRNRVAERISFPALGYARCGVEFPLDNIFGGYAILHHFHDALNARRTEGLGHEAIARRQLLNSLGISVEREANRLD
jgi:hypothetical protein